VIQDKNSKKAFTTHNSIHFFVLKLWHFKFPSIVLYLLLETYAGIVF